MAEKETLIRFLVSERQKGLIQQKMEQIGVRNMSAYLRKMAIDGYIIHLDLTEIREFIKLLRNVTNNFNQIARHANETGYVNQSDVSDMKVRLDEVWEMTRQILINLSGIG